MELPLEGSQLTVPTSTLAAIHTILYGISLSYHRYIKLSTLADVADIGTMDISEEVKTMMEEACLIKLDSTTA